MATRRVSHTGSRPRPPARTVGQALAWATDQLTRARLHYGHGTDNPGDDAAALVWHVMGLEGDADRRTLARRLPRGAQLLLDLLVARRIRQRMPVVYLTRRCWFAGLPMYVDERVLVPRSPIAELVEARFEPWIDPQRVQRILDVGTGSGCIAIGCAVAFPQAQVDAVDISPEALQVADINRRAHGVQDRLQLLQSDYFAALKGRRYDIIVSNPPYVGTAEFRGLPSEYRHEPAGALLAGRDGLDAVRVLLREARRHLTPHGILVVEVGNTEATVRRRWRNQPFVWLEFQRGGGGVFILQASQLAAFEKDL